MIPKIIHFCWLSNDPYPSDIKKFMDTWKAKLPDYEFIHWNFDRFDKESSLWVQQAYDNKKYAFAADYIRLYAIYHYGGIYLDCDVEVLKSFDPFLHLPTFMSYEKHGNGLEVAVFGAQKHSPWVKECLAHYENRAFIKKDNTFDTDVLPQVIKTIIEKKYRLTLVSNIKEAEQAYQTQDSIAIFPCDFFSPKSYSSGKITITENTCSIHHFSASWVPWYTTLEKKFWQKLGVSNQHIIFRVNKYLQEIKTKLSSK